jgi:hypothetical protein
MLVFWSAAAVLIWLVNLVLVAWVLRWHPRNHHPARPRVSLGRGGLL